MNWWHYWMMTNPACTVTRGCTASTIQCCQAIDLNLQLSDIGLLGAFILGSRFYSYHVLRNYSRARASHFLKVTPHAVIFSAIILRMLTIKSLSHRANIVPRSLCHTYLSFLLQQSSVWNPTASAMLVLSIRRSETMCLAGGEVLLIYWYGFYYHRSSCWRQQPSSHC